MVIAGTVFNQVVVWPVGGAPSGSEAKQHSPVMHRLAGHQVSGGVKVICLTDMPCRLCSSSVEKLVVNKY